MMWFVRVLIKKNQKFLNCFFLNFFLERIRYLWYKQQGYVIVLISYQMQKTQCSTFKMATCEAYIINNKIFELNKKLCILEKNNTKDKNFFYILHFCIKFQSLRVIIFFFFQNRFVPLRNWKQIDTELLSKIRP